MSKELDLRAHPIVADIARLFTEQGFGAPPVFDDQQRLQRFEKGKWKVTDSGEKILKRPGESAKHIVQQIIEKMKEGQSSRGVVMLAGMPADQKSTLAAETAMAWQEEMKTAATLVEADAFLGTPRGSSERDAMHDDFPTFREAYARPRKLRGVVNRVLTAAPGEVVAEDELYDRTTGGTLDGIGIWELPPTGPSLVIVEGVASAMMFRHSAVRDMPHVRVASVEAPERSLLSVCFRDAKKMGASLDKPTDDVLIARFVQRIKDATYLMAFLAMALRSADIVLVNNKKGCARFQKKYAAARAAYPHILDLASSALTQARETFIEPHPHEVRRAVARNVAIRVAELLELLPLLDDMLPPVEQPAKVNAPAADVHERILEPVE